MTIYDILYLLTDDTLPVAIYDMGKDEEVFNGTARDAMFDFGELEVLSFDHDSFGLTLNVESEEE